MSEQQTQSAIHGTGHGSAHFWIYVGTGASRASRYDCRDCGITFFHHYPSIPDIFESMAHEGVPETCSEAPHA